MEERFFALTGNEFGVHLDATIKLVSWEKALADYIQFIEDYGCASLHEVRDGEIIRIEQKCEL